MAKLPEAVARVAELGEEHFRLPRGGAEHHNHQTYGSTNVLKILDTISASF
jgi:hypothetical protein